MLSRCRYSALCSLPLPEFRAPWRSFAALVLGPAYFWVLRPQLTSLPGLKPPQRTLGDTSVSNHKKSYNILDTPVNVFLRLRVEPLPIASSRRFRLEMM